MPQHSFFQLLHQGTDVVPVDFIVAAQAREADADHHRLLVRKLSRTGAGPRVRPDLGTRRVPRMRAAGVDEVTAERLAPHRTFPGDRPSTTIVHHRLDPRSLGRLVALYEHRVFVEGVLWDVNSFDQWGVELGKKLADQLRPALDGSPLPEGGRRLDGRPDPVPRPIDGQVGSIASLIHGRA